MSAGINSFLVSGLLFAPGIIAILNSPAELQLNVLLIYQNRALPLAAQLNTLERAGGG